MGGDRFSSGDGSARGGRSRNVSRHRRARQPVGETHRSGYDAGKKIKGGKRHIVTDTGGLPITVMVPRRWVVERTFAWLGRCRRLAKDVEATIKSAVA